MQMIKLFDKIEERENKVFAFIPGLKSEVFPLTHISTGVEYYGAKAFMWTR